MGGLLFIVAYQHYLGLLQAHHQETEATRLARADFDRRMRVRAAAGIRDLYKGELAELQASRAASEAPPRSGGDGACAGGGGK